MGSQEFEMAARLTKAHAIARVIRTIGKRQDLTDEELAAIVSGWSDAEWNAARIIAKVHPPSKKADQGRGVSSETRRAVLHFLSPAVPADDPYVNA